jgi:hypothetical protein
MVEMSQLACTLFDLEEVAPIAMRWFTMETGMMSLCWGLFAFDLSLEFEPVLSFALIGGVKKFVLQFEHLASGMKCNLNGDSADLSAIPEVTPLDPVSITKKEFDLEGSGLQ